MSADIEEAINKDERAMERLATAFERIAERLDKFYEKMYPPKDEPRDVTLTRLPDTLDTLKANQGASEEATEDWLTDVGPRELEFIEKGAATAQGGRESRFDKKASRSRPPKSTS